MKQIEQYSKWLRELGIQHNVWKNRRIYFKTDKTAKAYLEFDEPECVDFEKINEGVALRVFSSCDTQSLKWNVNRAKQIKHSIGQEIFEDVCEKWEDIILP